MAGGGSRRSSDWRQRPEESRSSRRGSHSGSPSMSWGCAGPQAPPAIRCCTTSCLQVPSTIRSSAESEARIPGVPEPVLRADVRRCIGLLLSAGSLLIDDPVVLLNAYQLLGFFMTGFAGFVMFRALRLRNVTAVVFGTVFALAPFHFERVALGHAFVANYWGVAVLLILVLIAGGQATDPVCGWANAAPTRAGRIARRLAPILVMTLALSLTNSYYFAFAGIILACVIAVRAIVCLITRVSLRGLLWPVVALGSLVLFVGIQLAVLSLNFGDRYKKYFSARSPIESEQHSGKITTLLLPWPGTGVPGVGGRVREYAAQTTVSPYAEPTGMSVLAIAGIVLLVVWTLARLTVPIGELRPRMLADQRLSVLGLAFWIGLLFYAVGGLGFLFAVLVTPEIRAWVRLSIVLATIGLAVLAILIETAFTRHLSLWIALGLILVVAFVDQIAGVREEVDLQPTADTELRTLIASADAGLDRGCGLAQLPVKGFPESGPVGGLGTMTWRCRMWSAASRLSDGVTEPSQARVPETSGAARNRLRHSRMRWTRPTRAASTSTVAHTRMTRSGSRSLRRRMAKTGRSWAHRPALRSSSSLTSTTAACCDGLHHISRTRMRLVLVLVWQCNSHDRD